LTSWQDLADASLPTATTKFDGSPLRALQCSPGFTSVILVESSAKLRVTLEKRVSIFGDRVKVLPGDCNADNTIADIRSQIPAKSLTLAFADMLGLEVTFETLRQRTKNQKMDLAITFQVSDLVRNVPQISSRAWVSKTAPTDCHLHV
jgi:three-Cys-motif partner protein